MANERLRKHLDGIFSPYEDKDTVRDLKEELLRNLQDKFDDLEREGADDDTAFRLNNDVTKGIFERFHSMPIAKSSVLAGHVLSSLVFNTVSVLLVLLFAFVLGFGTYTGIVG
jgi:hypothetical protein